ncbi:MAG: type II toxin-antitoxin system VapC family toxin [Candidatus Aminicenantes bacterium]|nr:type II toxin-antitoxin system VapC family toxin [Candidatus Aminicenantes bacterium]
MSGKSLLDTNIVIALFKNEKPIVRKIRNLGEVYIPVTVVGELYYGAYKSQQVGKNLEKIFDFLADSDILGVSEKTARIYGEIKSRLKKKGRPIPENDIWIAAIARQYELPLVTKDKHFSEIEELELTLL